MSIGTDRYLPSKMRDRTLYRKICDILDAFIDAAVQPHVDIQQHQYDPSSDDYDPEMVLKLIDGYIYQDGLDIDIKKLTYMLPRLYHLKGTSDGIKFLLSVLGVNVDIYQWWDIKRSYNGDKVLYSEWQHFYPELTIDDVENCEVFPVVELDPDSNPLIVSSDDILLKIEQLISIFSWVCSILYTINFVVIIPTTHVFVDDKLYFDGEEDIDFLEIVGETDELNLEQVIDLDLESGPVCFQYVDQDDYVIKYNGIYRHLRFDRLHWPVIYRDTSEVPDNNCDLYTDYLLNDSILSPQEIITPTDDFEYGEEDNYFEEDVVVTEQIDIQKEITLSTMVQSRIRHIGIIDYEGIYKYDASFWPSILDYLYADVIDVNTNYTISIIGPAEVQTTASARYFPRWSSIPTEVPMTGTWSVSNSNGTIDGSGYFTAISNAADGGNCTINFVDPAGVLATLTILITPQVISLKMRVDDIISPSTDILSIPMDAIIYIYTQFDEIAIHFGMVGYDSDDDNVWVNNADDGTGSASFSLNPAASGLPQVPIDITSELYTLGTKITQDYNAYMWEIGNNSYTIVENTNYVLAPPIVGITHLPSQYVSATSTDPNLIITQDVSNQFITISGPIGTYTIDAVVQAALDNYGNYLQRSATIDVTIVASTGTINVYVDNNPIFYNEKGTAYSDVPGTWSSSNPAIVTINLLGNYKVISDVDANIILTFTSTDGRVGTIDLVVYSDVPVLQILPSTYTLTTGNSKRFKLLENHTNIVTGTFSITDIEPPFTGLVTLNDDVLTCNAQDVVTHTVTLHAIADGLSADAIITIPEAASEIHIKDVVTPLVLNVPSGETWNISPVDYDLVPPDAVDPVTISVSNPTVLTVQMNSVRAIKRGSSNVSVSTLSGKTDFTPVQVIKITQQIIPYSSLFSPDNLNTRAFLGAQTITSIPYYTSPSDVDNYGITLSNTGTDTTSTQATTVTVSSVQYNAIIITTTIDPTVGVHSYVLSPTYQTYAYPANQTNYNITFYTYDADFTINDIKELYNQTTTLNLTLPAGLTTGQFTVTWVLNNLQQVSASGFDITFKGISVGPATLTARIYFANNIQGQYATVSKTINILAVEYSVTLTLDPPGQVMVGQNAQIVFTPTGTDASVIQPVSWVSLNPGLLDVDQNGMVTGDYPGNATVQVTDNAGGTWQIVIEVDAYDITVTGNVTWVPATDSIYGTYHQELTIKVMIDNQLVDNYSVATTSVITGNSMDGDPTVVDPDSGVMYYDQTQDKIVTQPSDYIPDTSGPNGKSLTQNIIVTIHTANPTVVNTGIVYVIYPIVHLDPIQGISGTYGLGYVIPGTVKAAIDGVYQENIDIEVGEKPGTSPMDFILATTDNTGTASFIAVADDTPGAIIPLPVGTYTIQAVYRQNPTLTAIADRTVYADFDVIDYSVYFGFSPSGKPFNFGTFYTK